MFLTARDRTSTDQGTPPSRRHRPEISPYACPSHTQNPHISVSMREQESDGCQVRDHTARAPYLCCSDHLKEMEMYNVSPTAMGTAADLVHGTLPRSKDWNIERLVGAVPGSRTADLSEEI